MNRNSVYTYENRNVKHSHILITFISTHPATTGFHYSLHSLSLIHIIHQHFKAILSPCKKTPHHQWNLEPLLHLRQLAKTFSICDQTTLGSNSGHTTNQTSFPISLLHKGHIIMYSKVLWTCHGSQPWWKIPIAVTRFSCHSPAMHFMCR